MPKHALPNTFINARRNGTPTTTTPCPISGLAESQQVTVMQLMMLPKAQRAYQSEMRHFERSARRVALQKNAERIWQLLQHHMTGLSPRADH